VVRHYLPIVYVEDNEKDAALLRQALQQAKNQSELIHISDAGEARSFFLQSADQHRALGMIVTDLHIGAESGEELIKFIRSHEVFHKVPIIALADTYAYEELDAAYEKGANLFLIKPRELRGWTDLVFRLHEYFATSPV
jgi:CheY-like chemotaxis protein